MKAFFRSCFAFILKPLEAGNHPFTYKSSHRYILLFMSSIFLLLALGVIVLNPGQDSGFIIPVIIFGGGGFLGVVIALLAEDRAIAKLWGSSD